MGKAFGGGLSGNVGPASGSPLSPHGPPHRSLPYI